MNNPNAIPSFFQLANTKLVGAGLSKLPGASVFERPSTNITATSDIVDMIPRSDVYERSERGTKTEGTRLYRDER